MIRYLAVVIFSIAVTGVAGAQSAATRSKTSTAAVGAKTRNTPPAAARPASMGRILSQVVSQVNFQKTSARDAFDWWARTTSIPLVVHWPAFEEEGIDPETEVTLRLRNIPAGVLLKLIAQQMAPETPFIIEATPWYIEVMTKEQAIRNPVLRVYDIGDLLHQVPNFDNSPTFDLSEALSNTNSGGGGRSGGGNNNSGGGGGSGSGGGGLLFSDTDSDREREDLPTRADRAEEFAQLIRDTIEPEIWQNNGGQFCSIRYFDGRLIVNAPMYVHRQIGIPSVRGRGTRSYGTARRRPSPRYGSGSPLATRRSANGRHLYGSRSARGVSAVRSGTTYRTSGVAGR